MANQKRKATSFTLPPAIQKPNYFYKCKGGIPPTPLFPSKSLKQVRDQKPKGVKKNLLLHFGQVMNQTLVGTVFKHLLFLERSSPKLVSNLTPTQRPMFPRVWMFPLNLKLLKTQQNIKMRGGKNVVIGVFNIFVCRDFHGTFSRFMPDLPCPPAAWVWVLASWTSTGGPDAVSTWSEGTDPARPRPPAPPRMPGGRVTSIDAESTSFFRAVLISLSARWSEAWTVVSISDCGEVIPTDKNNSFSLFRVKRKQQHHPKHGNICNCIIFSS